MASKPTKKSRDVTRGTSPTQHVFEAGNARRWKYTRIGFVVSGIVVVIAFIVGATILFSVPALTAPKFAHLTNGGELQSGVKLYTPVEKLRASRENAETFLEYRQHSRADTLLGAPQIRAAFYVNWDALSFESLKNHIQDLNAVFLEWSRIVPNRTDSLIFDPDSNAARLLSKHPNVHVHCMVSNYDETTQTWRGDLLKSMLASEWSRAQLVQTVVRLASINHFYGINIDFEEVPKDVQHPLHLFLAELKQALHSRSIALSLDVPSDDDNFDLSAYAVITDYLVLMAYDQHSAGSVPGPISSLDWFLDQVARATKRIPPEKLIVGLATYGYNWATTPRGVTLPGDEISFQQACVTAVESDTIPSYDTVSGSLHFGYSEDDSTEHEVWVNDAVTLYNQLAILDEYHLAGTTLWRLGAEDPSIWAIYKNPAQRKPDSLRRIESAREPEYQGEGEILSVVAEPREGIRTFERDSSQAFIENESFTRLPSNYSINRYGTSQHKVVLSFDDGPDPTWTPKILDVLSQKHVPALFFVVGENAERNFSLLQRISREGHEIGNHTLTHPNIATISQNQTRIEISSTENIIEAGTLTKTMLFRPPYVADAEPTTAEELLPVARASRMGYLMVGSAIDPQDWNTPTTVQRIVDTCLAQRSLGSIILLHDAGGDRSATLAALPILIDSLRARGDTLVSLAEFAGFPKTKFMQPLVGKERQNALLNSYLLTATFYFQLVLSDIFFLAIALSIMRMLFIAFLAIRQWQTSRHDSRSHDAAYGEQLFVTVLIPAFNENVVLVRTVETVLESRYRNFEVIVIDDGSTDDTYEITTRSFEGNTNVRVLTKQNGGKASALNLGIANSTGEIIVVIDADTIFDRNALGALLNYFERDEKVGAVAGNVKVGNIRNILTRWQAIEYITSQNFDRRAFELLDAITVVPGAIGAFRRKALNAIGLYASDTLAEDNDLTMRMVFAGWDVRYADHAIAWTEAPETVRAFVKQRFRWTFGTMQAFWKHRAWMLNPKAGALGMIAMPNILLFQILLPLLAPIVDLLFILSIVSGNSNVTIISYLVFLGIDLLGSIVAFSLEGEKFRLIWWLPLQRFLYRQIMYVVLYRSVLAALRGQLQSWGKLQRTGSVNVAERS